MPSVFRPCLLATLVLFAHPAGAFDYLEHSYVTDRACRMAQAELAESARSSEAIGLRYLALSLTCPEKWDRPYCADGYKQLEANVNRLAEPPAQSGDHPITLGDLAALPDHLANFGPLRTVPQASAPGLTQNFLEWLARTGDAGGVISDVAEDACEIDRMDWAGLDADLTATPLPSEASARWQSSAWSPIERGPRDPSGAYSFDNPQYLDLVLHNHHHFGRHAYASWLGFHTAAVDVSRRSCRDILGSDADALEDLADGLPELEAIDFHRLEGPALREAGCRVVAERVKRRVREWASRAEPGQVAPVASLVQRLSASDELAEALVPVLLSVVLEGSGVHFLQDGFSGGHVRINRAALGLEDSRHVHDADGAMGVVTTRGTAGGTHEFVAFGDGFLLGTAPASANRCEEVGPLSSDEVAACLLRQQRTMVAGSTVASLVDWALQGEPGRAGPCTREDALHQRVCRDLPTRPTLGTGLGEDDAPTTLARGTMPASPPPFSYQSYLISTGVDLRGGPPQIGVRAVFLSALGSRANWMTSYDFGLVSTLGSADSSAFQGEFAYTFHWRWAARFLLHAGPFAFAGLSGLGRDVSFRTGVGPTLGLTLLPEGWIQAPLDITFAWRAPVTLVDSRRGFGLGLEAHYLELSLGLAFF